MMPVRLQSRVALGLAPTPRPGLLLLPIGMALGPAGLNVLSGPVLALLDPAISVALAALGVFAGLDLGSTRRRDGALLGAAVLEGVLTAMLVTVAAWITMPRLEGLPTAGVPLAVLALLFGLTAAASSSASGEAPDRPATRAARVGDLDDVLPIVFGGLAIIALHATRPMDALSITAQTAGIAVIVAVAGWLLVGQATGEGEQHVFVAGTLLLFGGAAAYLAVSALLVGLIGGLVWGLGRGASRESIDRDMRYLQHPLVVLLLLTAGARLQLSLPVLAMSAIYLACRTAGKLAGGWFATRAVDGLAPDLGGRLLSPGVIAIALALNVVQATGGAAFALMLLAVAVLGSLGSELLSVLLYPERRGQ